MKYTPRLFSIEEANALLPVLEERLGQMMSKKDIYTHRHDKLFMHQLISHAEQCGGLFQDQSELEEEIKALESAIADLEKDVHEIFSLGCILRNVETGMIDFPGKYEGRVVYFCWKKGETSIQYYHAREKGASERVPLLLQPPNLDKQSA